MSRIPQASTRPSQARPAVKTTLAATTSRSRASSPSKPPTSGTSSPAPTSRVRTKSIPKSPSKSIRRASPEEEIPVPKAPALSIKEAVALKRAEAKKVAAKSISSGANLNPFEDLADAIPEPLSAQKQEDDALELGRWSVKETIERARSTGSLNLASRSLPCLPSALFEIHLGITPDPLKSVVQEPPITSAESSSKRPTQHGGPAWFEAQDLQVLKAWCNVIVEIQHEISLFGSLKVVDLHQNKISSLPDTFADLTALTTLDLSHNSLTSLPHNIWTLPTLSHLNLSHNALTSLPFGEPFGDGTSRSVKGGDTWSSGGFFGPVITRATTPLPRLSHLDVSFNKLMASTIDHNNLPSALTKFDLSSNPISSGNTESASLLRTLGSLKQLKELRFSYAAITDDAFPPSLTGGDETQVFPALSILDLEETQATAGAVQQALSGLKQTLLFDFTKDEPPEGTLMVAVGKKVVKEPWEVEAERRARHRSGRSQASHWTDSLPEETQSPQEHVKDARETEQGADLFAEGRRRPTRTARPAFSENTTSQPEQKGDSLASSQCSSAPSSSTSQSSIVNLSNMQYFNGATQTLTLPPLAPPTRSHTRSFSLAASTSGPSLSKGKIDIALPTATLPLTLISSQPFAHTLQTLVLSSRKLDLSVVLPSLTSESSVPLLPALEELVLDGCGLGDTVAVARQGEGCLSTPPKSTEALLPLLTRLFPGLRTLDLTYNFLTSSALRKDVLAGLIMASTQDTPARKGLRHLRLRGNRITDLDGFQELAEVFKGHRVLSDWKLEELDLRDNEISKLPPELGLLPLDVFLVDGNVFRIPQRKVWEREGTKGLLSWLRGRLD
ncbi:hypothetical protein BKA82DRAFT_4076913 [Pisolithus tinctorius]|nr:hypothetical protein BKA82DRAFT_4076913 [Pisolithus tinctorius]